MLQEPRFWLLAVVTLGGDEEGVAEFLGDRAYVQTHCSSHNPI